MEIPSTLRTQSEEKHDVSLGLPQSDNNHNLPNYFDIIITEEKFKEISKVCENFEDFSILISEYYKDFNDLLRARGLNAENENEYCNAIKYMIYSDIYVSMISMGSSMDIKDKEGFALLYDVAHPDKKYKENWMEFYKEIKPYVFHVHVKDHIRAPFKIVAPGKGEIPFADICNTLEKDGYDGYYSLEWERKWHPDLEEITVALDALLSILK